MKTAMEWKKALEGYRLYCTADGKSPNTTRWYLGKLRIFGRYLEANGYPTELREITTAHIRAFLVYLRSDVKADQQNPNKHGRDDPLSGLTIQGYVRTLKAFYSWLLREEYIEDNPMRHIRIPRAPKVVIETFTDEQIERLLAAVDVRKPLGFRDHCILLILLDTGMRLSELAGLCTQDVDLETGEFKVTGKGQKQRVIPMGGTVQKVLWKYLNRYRREPAIPSVDHLFLDRTGMPMSPDSIYRMVRKHGRNAQLESVRCSPHTFRHTFAKNYLLNGGDVFSLQKILGHSSLEVVKLYVNLAAADVRSQHRRFSPVDMMRLRS